MFEQRLSKINKTPRAVQTAYEDAVSTGLQLQHKVSLIQADTGVGKSLAYCHAAVNYWMANPEHRVIIATNTIQLLRDLKTEALPDALKMLSPHRRPKVAMTIAASNYISPARLQRALRNHSATQIAMYRDELDRLMTWDQEIDRYLDEYVELPLGLRAEQICQTPYEQEDWYQENREANKDSDILLVSHALLVSDIMTRGAVLSTEPDDDTRRTVMIIDEADAFYEVMDSYQEHRLNLRDLTSALRRLPSPHNRLAEKAEQLSQVVIESCPAGIPYKRVTQESETEWVRDEIKAISQSLSKVDMDEAFRIRSILGAALMYSSHRLGYGRTRILYEPDLVFTDPFFTRTFRKYAVAQQSVVMTSGTLATSPPNEHGLAWLYEAFRLKQEDIGHVDFFAPEQYGQMTFVLAGGTFPRVFSSKANASDTKYSPAWLDAVANQIDSLSGEALVLTSSHEESQLIAQRLGRTDLVVHQSGQKLSSVIKAFQEQGGILITAAGKAGMNLRSKDGQQMMENIVITRLPFSPPQHAQERNMADYLRRSTDVANPDAVASRFYYKKNINSAIRRLKQSLGRGIRDHDDAVTITILDPRFPLFTEINSLKPLKSAIPERFQMNYRQASVVSEQKREVGLW